MKATHKSLVFPKLAMKLYYSPISGTRDTVAVARYIEARVQFIRANT